MFNNFRSHRLVFRKLWLIWFVLSWSLLLFGQNAVQAASAVVSQGLTTSSDVKAGAVVSRDTSSSQTVVLSDSKNREFVIGVVINLKDSLVAYNAATSKVQVATSGLVLVNASTINGEIHKGDYLTVSPLAGVAMKATENGKVVGVAQSDLLASSSGVEKRTIKDKTGQDTSVALGQISVEVGVTDWANQNTGSRNGFLDSVQNVAQAITGRDVTPVRSIIAAMLILIAMLISAIILYSSISSSIRSIGRNPLSHSAIKRSLLLVIIVVLLIMIAAFTIAYIIIGR